MSGDSQIEKRLKSLETHLEKENDILLHAVQSFRDLDKIAYKLGVLDTEQSYATRVSWWPMISVLGTFSAGKSTFINHYLGYNVQRTGSQAVDDRFTVMCFSGEESVNTLPGIALDADPRFPFYQISRDIATITAHSGQRVDAFLQLKTCPSEQLRGRILIDSPGFDADNQRTSTLRITQYIIDLSDLVLVFFDARHPEPGAMHDTLEHLVTATINRADSNKFLYILNQMDTTAREDNPEEVVAAWQRSLAQAGLTAGRFYRIYNPSVSIPFTDPQVKERYEKKCQADIKEIQERMEQIGTERAYRIMGMLEQTAKDFERSIIPQLRVLIQRWKKSVFWIEGVLLLLIILLVGLGLATTGTSGDHWQRLVEASPTFLIGLAVIIVVGGLWAHLKISKLARNRVLKKLEHEIKEEWSREGLTRAFEKNTRSWRALFIWFIQEPAGWSASTRKQIYSILNDVNGYVKTLNDRFTNPSGVSHASSTTQSKSTESSEEQKTVYG